MSGPIQNVLFDLDGTLADTAPDLGAALNLLLGEHDRPALPVSAIRYTVSQGAGALIRRAFGVPEGSADFEALRNRFLALYAEHIADHSVLFPGTEALLDRLETTGIRWGVVTNKPARFTQPLLVALGLETRAACVVSGDTVAERKPHPAPMLHACAMLRCDPAQAVYVGDARRDVEAGRGAGTATLIARYGYVAPDEDLDDWGADGIVDAPAEILAWVGRTPLR